MVSRSIKSGIWSAICHPHEVLRDVKLYLSGHRRVAPYGTRGRTHVKRGDGKKSATDPMRAHARPVASIIPTRVYCAKDRKWYTMAEWQDREK